MAPENKRQRKPAITMTRSDRERLWRLAESYAVRNPDVADVLMAELERARVVEDGRIAGRCRSHGLHPCASPAILEKTGA